MTNRSSDPLLCERNMVSNGDILIKRHCKWFGKVIDYRHLNVN